MIYQFGEFELDAKSFELRLKGQVLNIERQVFELLHVLVRSNGGLVTKDEINAKVWHGRVVSEAAVNSRISTLRATLGDDGRRQSIIKTVHNRGLRFLPDVTIVPSSGSEPLPETNTAASEKFTSPANQHPPEPNRKVKWPHVMAGFVAGIACLSLMGWAKGYLKPVSPEQKIGQWSPQMAASSHMARDAYLRGTALRKRGSGISLIMAAAQYEIAIKADPEFAAAYAGLAEVLNEIYRNEPDVNADLPARIETNIVKARALAPQNIYVRIALAEFLYFDGEYEQAVIIADELIEQDQYFLPAYINKGKSLIRMGRIEDGIEALGVAISLDPMSPVVLYEISRARLLLGNEAGAYEGANANYWWNQNSTLALRFMSEFAYNKANYVEAHKLLSQAKREDAVDSETRYALMNLYLELGMSEARSAVTITKMQTALDHAFQREVETTNALLSGWDLDVIHPNIHYYIMDYSPAARRYGSFLVKRGEAPVLPSEGLQFARMCHVFKQTNDPLREKTCESLRDFYAEKAPEDVYFAKDLLGGIAWYMSQDEPEMAERWFETFVARGYVHLSLAVEPVLTAVMDLPVYEGLEDKMRLSAQAQIEEIRKAG